jgi:hypothetical protein
MVILQKGNIGIPIPTNPLYYPVTEDIDYIDVTDEPQHVAFLGPELAHK